MGIWQATEGITDYRRNTATTARLTRVEFDGKSLQQRDGPELEIRVSGMGVSVGCHFLTWSAWKHLLDRVRTLTPKELR